jgi:hypothetical protein
MRQEKRAAVEVGAIMSSSSSSTRVVLFFFECEA